MMLELKKFTALITCLALVCALLSGCAQTDDANTLKVYNWGDYIAEGVIDDFEAETGIKVIYDTFDQNEDLYTKITTSSASYDVIIPSDYIIQRLISEDRLAKINMDNVPNYALIDDKFKHFDYDPNGEYSIPYMWGTVGIIYNTTMVSDPVDSWGILWDEKYAGQIFMMNSVRDSIGITLKYLGHSMNSTEQAHIDAARNKLIEQKPLVLAYTGDEIKDKMIAGEGALAVVYSGDAITMIEQNPDLAYAIPEEGSNLWYDGMCILKNSAHKENAEKFIDFMCRTDIAERNRAYINYSTPQKDVYEALPDEIRNDPTQYPSDELLAKCEVYKDLGERVKMYDQMWVEILGS